jgi:gamma-glutamyltranspeptidase/glutathione hydrolase
MFATRSVVYAENGMVAAAHPLAVQIGVDVLKQGGNAVDAAIAVNAALGFLEPTANGIGGDLFAIVWDAKSETVYGLNASGRSPLELTADLVPAESDGTIPLYSPFAWSVPGTVDGWFTLHERFGRLSMAEVLMPAIRIASAGAPVPQVIAAAWQRSIKRFGDKPGFAATFLPDGKAPREGEVFRNPDLAKSYRLLAEQGRDAFYRGTIAEAIVAFSEEHGGLFTMEDFARHASEWVEPLSTTYRGARLFELPPNGQGLAALQMLNVLEAFDLASMGRDSAEFWHVMVEAKKLAYEDRARFYADPAFADIPIEGLLSKRYAGFGLQNRGGLFNLDPESPNYLEPGKRPFHTIIPAFAMRDGKPWLAFGVMGGDMQPQGHVQILVNLIDFGMNLQEAGDAPRYYHSGSSEPTGTLMTTGGTLHLESGVSEQVRRELTSMGHRLSETIGSYGGYQAVAVDNETGVYAGATESRKDGCAMGY